MPIDLAPSPDDVIASLQKLLSELATPELQSLGKRIQRLEHEEPPGKPSEGQQKFEVFLRTPVTRNALKKAIALVLKERLKTTEHTTEPAKRMRFIS